MNDNARTEADERAEKAAKLAAIAAKEIPQLKDPQDVALWLQKYRMAGYRRLVHALLAYFGLK